MKTNSNSSAARARLGAAAPVSFVERFQASGQFDRVFREGMALVERTAAYLDGDGRRESRGLESPVAVLYATESMRLTTRLLDMASWLLIRRSVKSGEISEAEAASRRQRVRMQSIGRPSHVARFVELPLALRGLITESFALQDRILHLDRAVTSARPEPAASNEGSNPVARQMRLLEEAFSIGAA